MTAPNETTTCRVPRREAAAAELVEQLLEALAELLELGGVSSSVADDVCAARRQLGGSSCSRRSASRIALLLPADELVAQHGRLEPVGLELDPRRSGAPRPLAAGAALGLLDEPPLRERAQVVAARRRAVADRRAALGRRRVVDGVQVIEQREPRRMRKSAHRARVGQGE